MAAGATADSALTDRTRVDPAPADPVPGPAMAAPAASASGSRNTAAPKPVIELELDAADVPRLLRSAALTQVRRGRTKTVVCRRVWHDTASGLLWQHGLALSEDAGPGPGRPTEAVLAAEGPGQRPSEAWPGQPGSGQPGSGQPGSGQPGSGQPGHDRGRPGEAPRWRLERLVPGDAAAWPPGAPAPILAEGDTPLLLHRRLSHAAVAMLVPVAAFTGKRRSLALYVAGQEARLDILEGALRGVVGDEPACRMVLAGNPPAMAALVAALAGPSAGQVALRVPRAGLAARAIARADGTGAAAPPAWRTADRRRAERCGGAGAGDRPPHRRHPPLGRPDTAGGQWRAQSGHSRLTGSRHRCSSVGHWRLGRSGVGYSSFAHAEFAHAGLGDSRLGHARTSSAGGQQ